MKPVIKNYELINEYQTHFRRLSKSMIVLILTGTSQIRWEEKKNYSTQMVMFSVHNFIIILIKLPLIVFLSALNKRKQSKEKII